MAELKLPALIVSITTEAEWRTDFAVVDIYRRINPLSFKVIVSELSEKMDSNIRQLLHSSSENFNEQNLEEAYAKLKKERQSTVTSDKPDAVSSDLFVLCAETAFRVCTIGEKFKK